MKLTKTNNTKTGIKSGLAGCLILLMCQCSSEKETEVPGIDERNFTVESADEWTALFKRNSGWFGGDGIFAIPYSGKDDAPGDSVLLVFSDTMIGEIRQDKLEKGYVMINNSVALLKGSLPVTDKISFKMDKENDTYKSAFIPHNAPEGTYFWLGDGFVNHQKNKDIYLFAYQITNTKDNSQFPFKETGNVLYKIPGQDTFPYPAKEYISLPFNTYEDGSPQVSFGVGVLDNTPAAGSLRKDDYVYIYGVKDADKKLVAARVKPSAIEDFGSWEFYKGTGEWTHHVNESATIADSVANELSVSQMADGRYMLIYQLNGIYPDIMMQVGETPVGPFGPRIRIYDTRRDIQDPDLFTYNAKAHPALSGKGELLISYNVNSFKFFDIIESKPHLYRPRFFKLKFNPKTNKHTSE